MQLNSKRAPKLKGFLLTLAFSHFYFVFGDYRTRCNILSLPDSLAHMRTTHYTLHTTHYTLHTAHCTLHTAHCTLLTTYYTMPQLQVFSSSLHSFTPFPIARFATTERQSECETLTRYAILCLLFIDDEIIRRLSHSSMESEGLSRPVATFQDEVRPKDTTHHTQHAFAPLFFFN